MSSNRRQVAAQRKQAATGQQKAIEAGADYVAVAKLRRAHGLKGEVLAEVLSDFPDRIIPQAEFFLGPDHEPITVRAVREHTDGLLLSFDEFTSRESWQGRQNQFLFTLVKDLPALEDGEYYQHQLIGLKVEDQDGEELGQIAEILETGANDVYLLRDPEGKERLVPATTEVIREINIEVGLMRIQAIPGLFDE